MIAPAWARDRERVERERKALGQARSVILGKISALFASGTVYMPSPLIAVKHVAEKITS